MGGGGTWDVAGREGSGCHWFYDDVLWWFYGVIWWFYDDVDDVLWWFYDGFMVVIWWLYGAFMVFYGGFMVLL